MHLPLARVGPENVVEPLLRPGDAVFFENRTWHAAAANLSDHTRIAVMFGYGFQWFRPMDYTVQPPELGHKVDDIGRQLLGLWQAPNGQFVPGGVDTPLREWCRRHSVHYQPAP